MARYITLINFTEQGIKTIKDRDKRIAATRERLEYGLAGNGRSRTMRAFTSEETVRIVKQLG
jgi:uncharacterized protein with GYD domain